MNDEMRKKNFDTLYTMFFEKGFENFSDKEPVFEEVNGAIFDLVRKAYIAGCKYSYDIFTRNGSKQ